MAKTAEEIARKQREKEQKKQKKLLRRGRFRPIKNFLWWFTGIICGIIFLFVGLFAGVMMIPINTLTGGKNEGVVSEQLAGSTIGEVVFNIDKYGFSDLPVLTNLLREITSGEVGKFIEVDYEKLNTVKFGGETFGEDFKGCIKVVATIEDTLGTETLGDFGKLSVFNEWEEVEETVNPEAENFNAKLYYYNPNETQGMSLMASGSEYKRAYDDNGQRIAPQGAKLYYAALAKVPLLEAFDLIDERVGNIPMNELLSTLGGAALMEDSLIGNLLEGKNINEIGSITAEDILVSQVLGDDEDSDIAIVLEGATGKKYNQLTLNDLSASEFSLDDVKLSTFVNKNEVGDLAKILEDVFHADQPGGKTFSQITIADLSQLKFDHVHIATVLPNGANNHALVEILEDEFKKDYEEIMLVDLNSFDIDKLHLYKVLPENEIDDGLKQIIMDIAGATNYKDVYIADLHSGDSHNALDKVKLSTVLGEESISNPMLSALVKKNVTVGNLATAIDQLKICEVYGTNVFKPISGSAPAGSLQFTKSGNKYTMVTSGGTHYLNKDAGIWLLVGFTASNVGADGRPSTYTESSATMGDLQNGGSAITSAFENATIRQLLDCGVVASANSALYSLTLANVLSGVK